MRLNEIWDPSMYRSGDERNPQSPYYDGQEVEPHVETYPTEFQWHVYTQENDEIPCIISGEVTFMTEYPDYFPSRGRRYSEYDEDDGPEGTVSVSDIVVKQVKFNDIVMTGKQAEQKFGKDFVGDYASEMAEAAHGGIKGKGKFNYKPKVTDWQRTPNIEFQ